MCGQFRPHIVRVFLLLSILGVGCSGERKQTYFPVEGKVLVKGKPAAYARLRFAPVEEDPEEFMAGTTANEDGEFTLQAHCPRDGSTSIEYFVSVSWRIPKNPHSTSDPEFGKELLPTRFQEPKNSGLKVTISPGDTELEPFELNP